MAAVSPFLPFDKTIQTSEYYKAWDRKVILDNIFLPFNHKMENCLALYITHSKSTDTHLIDL